LEAPFAFEALASATEATNGLTHHFCPRCGAPLTLHTRDEDGGEQFPACTLCGRIHFTNAKPCAGALIVREGAVLLVRRAQAPFQGAWDIPGGFLNVDETPEAAAIREVREETNAEIRLLDFLGFYLDTYLFQDEPSTTLNIYFVAETEDTPSVSAEADAWRWFPVEALPENIAFEHAPQVLADLQTWIAEQEEKA
jgi:8-oxo-dGTP diphosphatase